MNIVSILAEKLIPIILSEVTLAMNSNQEAESFTSKLRKVQVGLVDAERKGVTDQNIRNWLREVEDLMFEMEDVVDEWEILNSSEDAYPSNPGVKVLSVIFLPVSWLNYVYWRRNIVLNMMSLRDRLDKILEEKNKYNFVAAESNHKDSAILTPLQSTCLLDKPHLYLGRELDQESLIGMLLSGDEERILETQIISIIGVGGVGKTALAQLAFNNPGVEAHFELKAWVFVGDPFDPTEVAKAILEHLKNDKNESSKLSTLNVVAERIKNIISYKKFLLVLDDVWTHERRKWEELKKCLINGAPGSRILVTTRNEEVARMMGTTCLQPLGSLSHEDCGTILNRIALEGRSGEEKRRFGDVGVEIAKKCNGLPLAAKSLGSMLSLKFTEQEWVDVLKSPLWKYENDQINDLFRLLTLSYLELNPILKRCFLSCILYPKGYPISLHEIIRRWVGFGYISSSGTEDEVQLKGLEYFRKLSMRSFIETLDSDVDGVIRFKVHDIMHDFATYMSEIEQISHLVIEPFGLNDMNSSSHTSAHQKNFSGKSLEKIRSFSARCVTKEELPQNLFCVLKSVRVLTVLGCNLQELPSDIGKLIHLRFLDLSWNHFRELPPTVIYLYHLETLDVQGCRQLVRLPQGIEKLRKLRHLNIDDTPCLREFPDGIQKMTTICTLNKFVVGEYNSEFGWLENLNEIRGSLSIEIMAAMDTKDAEKANLRNKSHIRHLELKFAPDVQMEVILEALKPPPEIETLVLSGYGGKQFPSWLMDSKCLGKLKKLTIWGFDDSPFPPFSKLPSLEELVFVHMKFKLLAYDFMSAPCGFGKLKMIRFYNCESWEEWEDIISEEVLLPCLREMVFVSCNNLKRLPHNLIRSAKTLKYLYIRKAEYLESLYNPESGSDWTKISHIPNVLVNQD